MFGFRWVFYHDSYQWFRPGPKNPSAWLARENKETLGWTLGDIKCISPLLYNIEFILGIMPNLTVTDKEGWTLPYKKWSEEKFFNGYTMTLFTHLEWWVVGSAQAVPTKTGITMIKSNKNELIPTRMQYGFRVCIDYRKLNFATRKGQFHLSFLDQILERLARHAFIVFLMGTLAIPTFPLPSKTKRRPHSHALWYLCL